MNDIALGIIISQVLIIPLAIKWELDLKTVIPAGLAVGLLAGIGIAATSQWFGLELGWRIVVGVALVGIVSAITLLARFYRDPARTPPEGEHLMVSPADGVVKYIKDIGGDAVTDSTKGNESVPLIPPFLELLPKRRGYLVGIGMSFLDVHVTRAPVSGTMTFCEHVAGSFMSLKKPEALIRNERVNQVISSALYGVGVIHIASRLVRRIVTYADRDAQVKRGQKIALITFGSQVDVVVPRLDGLQLAVGIGDKVFAGETVIARIITSNLTDKEHQDVKSSLS